MSLMMIDIIPPPITRPINNLISLLLGINSFNLFNLSYVWPLSYKSSPIWISLFITMVIIWCFEFLIGRKTSQSIKRTNYERYKWYTNRQSAMVKWSTQQKVKEENSSSTSSSSSSSPNSEQLFELLYDDIYQCPVLDYMTTNHHVTDNNNDQNKSISNHKYIHQLFINTLEKELQEIIKYTKLAQEKNIKKEKETTTDDDDDDDDNNNYNRYKINESLEYFKKIDEHENGEKLYFKLIFIEKVIDKFGSGGGENNIQSIFNKNNHDLYKQGKTLQNKVSLKHSKSYKKLLKLTKPSLPSLFFGLFATMMNHSLRGYFHALGHWTKCIELAAIGDMNAAKEAVFVLWLGHVIIEFIERVESSLIHRAETNIKKNIHNGVLSSMLSQDYEYFDSNPPSVLQERLIKDSDELGNNFCKFPQSMISRTCKTIVNIIYVIMSCPTSLILPAFSPLIVTIPLQYFSFQKTKQITMRQSKISEKSSSDTGEVLREIKTVRQFAQEFKESIRCSENSETIAAYSEEMFSTKACIDWLFWTMFVSGLIVTLWVGLGFVVSKEMEV